MELTATFMELLAGFRPAFTEPRYVTFRPLKVGWVLSIHHRYVTDLIVTSDSIGNGHFSDYHGFLARLNGTLMVSDDYSELGFGSSLIAVKFGRAAASPVFGAVRFPEDRTAAIWAVVAGARVGIVRLRNHRCRTAAGNITGT